jgi:hypothetical protein
MELTRSEDCLPVIYFDQIVCKINYCTYDHYIRRITIVQINLGVLFCNYSRNITVTTGEVVYSPVIYS